MRADLRPLKVDDWAAVHDWAQREEACRYQTWGPNTPEQTRAYVEAAAELWNSPAQQNFVYAIVCEARVVGTAGLTLRGTAQGEISYVVHPGQWGRGIATAAAGQLVDLGFRQHRLHRIFATCDPRNDASGRVLSKIGMVYEGRMRQTTWIRDGWRDSDLYAILEQDDRPWSTPVATPQP